MNLQLLEAKWNSCDSITNINHKRLVSIGIKGLLLDIDGTLLPRSEVIIHKAVRDWIKEARKYFKIHLVSNNPSLKRIKSIGEDLNLNFTYKAAKPSKKSIENCINILELDRNQVAIIGDRIFTDILAGNRSGIYTILVTGIGSDGKTKQFNITQSFEKTVVKFLEVFK